MLRRELNRREFLRLSALVTAGAVAAACAPSAPAPEPTPTPAPAPAEQAPAAAMPETRYREAPMLAELVRQGKLPPVDERLPKEPLVVEPIEEIGQYGGTWRQLHLGTVDRWQNSYLMFERFGKYKPDFSGVDANLAKAWEFSEDGKTITIYLREGLKWSDGAPFTTDDIMFWYEDIILNDELSPTKPSQLKRAGELGVFEKIDDYTFKISFVEPYGAFTDFLPQLIMYQPAHYLKQFHAKYASQAELDAAIQKEGFDSWTDLFGAKTEDFNNPGTPTVMAWVVQNTIEEPVQTLERNPYYWKVDPEGNQLPYIDRVTRTLLSDREALLLKAIAGEVDFQGRRIAGLDNFPVVMENRERGDYRVVPVLSPGTNYGTIFFNYHHKDPVLKDLFHKLDFRIALSVAINRDEINELIFKGQATPSQATAAIGTPWYEEQFRTAYIEYDPDKANALLDGLGLTERDEEGFRLRPDGKRLSMVNSVFTPWPPDNVEMHELVKGYWKDIGVEVIVKPTDRQLWVAQVHGLDHDIAAYAANLGFWGNPPIVRETFAVNEGGQHWAPQWGLWYQTNGEEGEEPPEDVKKLQSLYEKVLGEVSTEKRIELQKEALALHAKNIWMIGLLAEPAIGRFVIVKNNFRNVPDKPFSVTTIHTAQFFFKQT